MGVLAVVGAHRGQLGLLAGLLLACAKPTATPVPQEPDPTPQRASGVADEASASPRSSAPKAATAIEPQGYTSRVEAQLAARDVDWQRAPTRVALHRRGHVRLRSDGPALGLGDLAPLNPAPRFRVTRDAERPVVVVDGDVRLLLHVDRADAAPVIVARAPLRPSPGPLGAPPRRGHVVLLPGAWVDVVEEREGAVKVAYAYDDPMARHDLRASGWVDADAIGSTGTLRTLGEAERDAVLVARRATRLLRAPDGKAMTRVRKDEVVLVQPASTTDGMRLVEYAPECVDVYAFVGFVAGRDLWRPYFGSMHGCGHIGTPAPPALWGEAEAAPRVRVAAGRFLLDPDTSRVVGCVVRDGELADLGDGRFAVGTMWGPIPVRLAPEGFGGACGTER